MFTLQTFVNVASVALEYVHVLFFGKCPVAFFCYCMLTYWFSEGSLLLKRRGLSLDWSLFKDTQLSPDGNAELDPGSDPGLGPGPAESRCCFCCLQ